MNNFYANMNHSQDDFVSSSFGVEFPSNGNQDSFGIQIPPCTDYQDFGLQTPFNNDYQVFTEGSFTSSAICYVCGAASSGRHYGADSCDGCKGFFRRTIRENKTYECRFQRNCDLFQDKRNLCRCCRFRKCLAVGMKKEAVQDQRDKIGSTKGMEKKQVHPSKAFFTTLLNAESIFKEETFQKMFNAEPDYKIASFDDVQESMKSQLLKITEWSQTVSGFANLSSNDRDALLRAHAKDLLLLELAHRSLYLTDMLVLANNCIIVRQNKENLNVQANADSDLDANFNLISERIMDELVKPLSDAEIDNNEFVALKALNFLDPNAKGLSDREQVRNLRRQISIYLEDYIKDNQNEPRGRFAQLLLTLPNLQPIANQIIVQMHVSKIFHGLEIDQLIEDMLLADTQHNPKLY